MSSFNDWIELYKRVNALEDSNDLPCPNCSKAGIHFQYVGDPETRIGYLALWCSFCLHGIHISRVLIPEDSDFLPFDCVEEEVANLIPNFTHVL
jgi:hypothetical protein